MNCSRSNKVSKEKELRYFELDAKSDRSADESTELELSTQRSRSFAEKEIPAIQAAQQEAEASIVERNANTPENRERRELRSKVSMGKYIASRLGGLDGWPGALGEYAAACGVAPNEIPVEYFQRKFDARKGP